MFTAFQSNAFQVGPALAFQITFDQEDDTRTFTKERRKIFKGRAPLSLKMR